MTHCSRESHSSPDSKSAVSVAKQQLIELMQRLNFGTIRHLTLRSGEPVLSPPTTVRSEHKFGSDTGPRSELSQRDFPLKRQVVELFRLFDKIGDGTIELIEIKHGLPFRAIVEEPLSPRS